MSAQRAGGPQGARGDQGAQAAQAAQGARAAGAPATQPGAQSAAQPGSQSAAQAPAQASAPSQVPATQAGPGAASAGRARAGRRANTVSRSTPEMLRRLSAFGLLAGVLSGAASFGAITIGENAARTSATTMTTASAATRALSDIGTARAQASTAYLGGRGVTAADVQNGLGSAAVSLAAVRTADVGLAGEIESTQRALTSYSAAAGMAVKAGSGDTGAGQNLAVADGTLARSANVLERLAFGSGTANTTTAAWAAALLPLAVGGAATALLVGTGVWLARKTRRVINPPLLVGTLLVAGSLAIGVAATALPATAVDQQAGNGYLAPAAVALAAGSQSRAAELAAVLPGADVAAASAAAADARTQVETTLTGSGQLAGNASMWTAYGDRQSAVLQQATSDRAAAAQSATTTSRTAYEAYVAALPAVDTHAAAPSAPPEGTPWAWLALLTGIAGGALAWIGLDRRLKDYR